MEQQIHQELYSALEEEFSETFNTRIYGTAKSKIQRYLSEWQQKIGITEYDLDPAKASDFNRAFCVIYQTQPLWNRKRNTKSLAHVIAMNTDTGQLELLDLHLTNRNIENIKNYNGLQEKLRENKANPFPIETEINVINPSTGKARGVSIQQFFETLSKITDQSVRYLRQSRSLYGTLKNATNAAKAEEMMAFLEIKAQSVLEREARKLKVNIEQCTDQQLIEWSDIIRVYPLDEKEYSQVGIVNWMVQAPNNDAREYRYTAMLQYASLGSLYWDNKLWEDIDRGASPLKVLASELNIRPAILKKIIGQNYPFETEEKIAKYSKFLDTIDPQFWPEDGEQFNRFKSVVDLSLQYSEAFSRKPEETVKAWVKNNKQLKTWKDGFSWDDLFKALLKPQIEGLLLEEYGAYGEIPEVVKQEPNEALLKKATGKYTRDISDIQDMKVDIKRRLTQPMALIALENNGIKVTDAEALNGITDAISIHLYEGMTPSDQIKASAYWHSPNVDVQRRFNSAVMNSNSGYKEWEPLFEDEYWEASNGVRFYPLVSSEALWSEGNAMSHCVGSYTSSCMTNNYHIMSLTDDKENRLSTLTVQDYFEGGKRKVRSGQNRSVRNASPSQEAIEATKEFIDIVNEGKKIKPDWPAIDSIRAEYKANQIANQAGYDIHDQEQCQAVLDVYKPCVSKKVIRASGGDYNRLIDTLGVNQVVSDFIANFDFSQGGLVRVPDEQPMPQNNSQARHQRPRMA